MKMKIFISFIFFLSIVFSCTDNFEEDNTDEKHPQEVSGAVLFTKAEIDLADQISSTNVNHNIWKLVAQYWTERSYTDEANYDIQSRSLAGYSWKTYYAILQSLEEAKEYIDEESISFDSDQINKENRIAIIELVEVFIYQRLVDTFGNIPYTEALNSDNYTPKYDDAATIYEDLISRAKAAVESLDDTDGVGSFDSADLMYEGDVDSWIKFGNSLLVKLGIGIADGSLSSLGQATVEAAYDKAFTSMDDGAYFPYQESLPYVNPLYTDLVATGRHDFVMVTGMVELMDSLEDPRIDNYFEDLDGITTDYGASGGSYGSKVHYNDTLEEESFNGFILTYEEQEFYLAEAAARGWNVGSSAEDYFNDAVKNSIETWGGTEEEAATYLAANPYVTEANSPYSDWKEAIGTQAWLAMYTRGFIGYTFYRRLDNPDVLVMPPYPPTDVDEIITRFTYPVTEQTLNANNYSTASEAIGGDKLTTRIFWDVN